MGSHDIKLAFHRKWTTKLSNLARNLGLKKGEYRVSSNKAGPACLGEVYLHTDPLPGCVTGVQLWVGGSFWDNASGGGDFIYRQIEGKQSYHSGRNHSLPFTDLERKPEHVISAIKAVCSKPYDRF